MTKILIPIAIFVLSLVGGWVYFQSRSWEVDDATLMKRYGADCLIIELDGVSLRVSDQGEGPAIILVHGAFGSLNYWDDWAEELKSSHRVVRFDLPPEGVSGQDPKGYTHDRGTELIGLLADQLGIEKFALSGISLGGTVATLYASRNPDRVTHLILANTPLLNMEPSAVDIPESHTRHLWVSSKLLNSYRHLGYWDSFLSINAVKPERIERRWKNLYKDMNNRSGSAEDLAEMQRMGGDRPEERNRAAAAEVQAPTLFLITQSIALPPAEQQRVIELFSNTEVTVMPVDVGHFPAVELGVQTAGIAQRFISNGEGAGGDTQPAN